MERAEVLLLKLQEQYRRKDPVSQMLLTLQMLQQELGSAQQATSSAAASRSKVSVVLPFRKPTVVEDPVPRPEEKIVEVLKVDEQELEQELALLKEAAELRNEISTKNRPALHDAFDPLEEIPTLATHLPAAAVVIPQAGEPASQLSSPGRPVIQFEEETSSRDINEKFKPAAPVEVSHRLQDAPIKDLRKAIGINDRYLFINELFNGDEAMFERSVKTLNQFSILPEAEFWMQRELRIKLGWREDNTLVQQFVQLVRRRFS
jgi:hypothetical protein